MKYLSLCLSLVLSLGAFAEDKVINCIKVTTPPVIDGKLDDAVWSKCEKITGFLLNFDEEMRKGPLAGKAKELQGKPGSQQTEVWACYDDNQLYLAFKGVENNPTAMKALAQGPDDQIWNDDCVEFFIDTDNSKKTYYHVIINSQGAVYDDYVKGVKETKKETKVDSNIRWNAEGEVKTSVGDKFWIVEAALPLTSFKFQPKAGTTCGVNFTREQYTDKENPNCYTTWAELSGTFHQPAKFGTMMFK